MGTPREGEKKLWVEGCARGQPERNKWLGDMVMRAGVLSLFYAYPVGDFSTGA